MLVEHGTVVRMNIDSGFSGRIFQVVEALDIGDAVSNQVLAIDRLLREGGVATAIFTKWHQSAVADRRSDLETLQPTEKDIVLVHYAGYSGFSVPYVSRLHCTKVCVYHNITPASFFQPGTDLHEFCLKGRKQLPELVRDYHYFWGDSTYNLQELIELGAPAARCSVVPIIIDAPAAASGSPQDARREAGAWLFLGRIAANKGQVELVRLFASVRDTAPGKATRLYLVGNYNPDDPYFLSLEQAIKDRALSDLVVITGKVPDEDIPQYFRRCEAYVSMSEHEGFGVPLIEAAHHGLPVVAVRGTAVAETLGEGPWLVDDAAGLQPQLLRLLADSAYRKDVLAAQRANAARFATAGVRGILQRALSLMLPRRDQFTRVSVVICTYNRADLLDRALDYLQYQTCQQFEVVVIDGPSTDGTDAVLHRYRDRIRIGRNPVRNLSVSRNLGIELSAAEIIAFIDDDAIPFDDWVATILREFNSRPLTHAAFGGPAYFAGQLRFQAEDIGINSVAEARQNIDSAEIGRDGWRRSMLGTNTCFRADILRETGGFDEEFDYFLDESEISYRLQESNYIVGYVPDLYLRHEFAESANRDGEYSFNWYSICKNTAYFIAAYSGMRGSQLSSYIDERIERERLLPLQVARREKRIPEEQYCASVDAIRRGIAAGLADSARFPQTRRLGPPSPNFSRFAAAQTYPVAGRDIPALHVCLVTREFPPFVPGGGIGTLYYHLASELLLMGHRVTVVTAGLKREVYRSGRFAVNYEPVATVCTDAIGATAFAKNVNWSFAALHAVAALHASSPVDVIDSALWDTEALMLSLVPTDQRPPLLVRLVTPLPVAARLNGWTLPAAEARLLQGAELALVNGADAVVAISESIAATIEAEYGLRRDERWRVSHCGLAYWPSFDFSRGYTSLAGIAGLPEGLDADVKLILFVGRLELRKGVDLILDAAETFLRADPSARLVLVGRDVDDLENSCRRTLGPVLGARVHFLGQTDDPTRDKLLHAAYCLLFPSRYESFGLVPLEAFVQGVPVIASRSGAIPEVVVDGDCGLLFEPGNSQELGDRVVRLIGDPALRQRLAEGARRRARHFSSRRSAIETVKTYAGLLRRGG
jgi:glycosyltransferase involved in cell wall biosynthesis